jgi:hypothetical protein
MKYFKPATEYCFIAAMITVAIVGGVAVLSSSPAVTDEEQSVMQIAIDAANESGLSE